MRQQGQSDILIYTWRIPAATMRVAKSLRLRGSSLKLGDHVTRELADELIAEVFLHHGDLDWDDWELSGKKGKWGSLIYHNHKGSTLNVTGR